MNKECKFCGDNCLCKYQRVATTADGINLIIEDTIEIPRSWLEGLIKRKQLIEYLPVNSVTAGDVYSLLGYIDSAEHILGLNQKKDV